MFLQQQRFEPKNFSQLGWRQCLTRRQMITRHHIKAVVTCYKLNKNLPLGVKRVFYKLLINQNLSSQLSFCLYPHPLPLSLLSHFCITILFLLNYLSVSILTLFLSHCSSTSDQPFSSFSSISHQPFSSSSSISLCLYPHASPPSNCLNCILCVC